MQNRGPITLPARQPLPPVAPTPRPTPRPTPQPMAPPSPVRQPMPPVPAPGAPRADLEGYQSTLLLDLENVREAIKHLTPRFEESRKGGSFGPLWIARAATSAIQGPAGMARWLTRTIDPAAEAAMVDLQARLAYLTDQAYENERTLIMIELPAAVDYGVAHGMSLPDIMQVFEEEGNQTDNQMEKEFLRLYADSVDKAGQAERVEVTPEERAAMLQAVGQNRSITIHGVIAGSSRDLLETLMEVRQPRLRPQDTIQDVKDALTEVGVPGEQAQALMDKYDNPLRVYARGLAEARARIDVLKSSFASMELDDLKAEIQSAMIPAMWTRPALALGVPFEWWYKKVGQPLAGAFLMTQVAIKRALLFGQDPEDTELEWAYSAARESGLGVWPALGQVRQSWNANGFAKFIVDAAADPSTYIGFGVTAPLKKLPLLGRLYGLEKGYQEAVDLGFSALKNGIFKLVPKMPGQESWAKGLAGSEVVMGYLTRKTGRPISEIASDRAAQLLQQSVEYLQAHPNAQDYIADAARVITDAPPVTREMMAEWAEKLGVDLDWLKGLHAGHIDFTDIDIMTDLDDLLRTSRLSPGASGLTMDETADAVLNAFAADKTVANKASVKELLELYRRKILNNVDSLIQEDSWAKIHRNLVQNTIAIESAKDVSLIAGRRAVLARAAAMMSRVPGMSKALWGLAVAQRANYGLSRMYLFSLTYTPANMIEMGLKLAEMKLDPWGAWKYTSPSGNFRSFDWHQGLTRNMPEMFMSGTDTFITMTGERASNTEALARLSRASRTDIVKPGMYRRVMDDHRRNIIQKLMIDLPDEYLVKTGGRATLAMADYAMVELAKRQIMEDFPVLTQSIIRYIDQATMKLGSVMESEVAESLRGELLRRAITGADSLTRMPIEFSPNPIIAAKIQELASKYSWVSIEMINMMVNRELSGRLTLDALKEIGPLVEDSIWDDLLGGLDKLTARLPSLVATVLESKPRTANELLQQVMHLNEIGDTLASALTTHSQATQAKGATILNRDKKKHFYESDWAGSRRPALDAASEQSKLLAQSVSDSLATGGFEFTPAQRFELQNMIDLHMQHSEALRQVRMEQHILETGMLDDYEEVVKRLKARKEDVDQSHPDIRAWWDKWYAERQALWSKMLEQETDVVSKLDGLTLKFMNGPLPPAARIAGSIPTPLEIARLFSVSPDAVGRNVIIPELGVLRTKKEFVKRILARADRVASGGKTTALEMGYTADTIGLVYDQLLKNMRANSEMLQSVAHPRLAEWESLRQELVELNTRRNYIVHPEWKSTIEEAVNGPSGLLARMSNDPEMAPLFGKVYQGKFTLEDGEKFYVSEGLASKSGKIQPLDVKGGKTYYVDKATLDRIKLAVGEKQAGAGTTRVRMQPDGTVLGVREDLPTSSSFVPTAPANVARVRVGTEPAVIRGMSEYKASAPKAVTQFDSATQDILDRLSRISDGMQKEESALAAKLQPKVSGSIPKGYKRPEDLLTATTELADMRRELFDLRTMLLENPGEGAAYDDVIRRIATLKRSTAKIDSALQAHTQRMHSPEFQTEPEARILDFPKERRMIDQMLDDLSAGVKPVVTWAQGVPSTFPAPADIPTGAVTTPLEKNLGSISSQESFGVGTGDMGRYSASPKTGLYPVSVSSDGLTFRAADHPIVATEGPGKPWLDMRQESWDKAVAKFELSIPDYQHQNAFNSMARAIFPFWSYASHRWWWLGRQALRHPGLYTNWGRYMDSTDKGYMTIPGTDLEINWLRGMIFMGGMPRLAMGDFPEFSDNYPGVSGAVDTATRMGFYAGPFFQTFLAAPWANKMGRSQFGEVAPPVPKALMSAVIALKPDSTVAHILKEYIIPSRYDDYQQSQWLNAHGQPGNRLLDKKVAGLAYTPEEQAQWDTASRTMAGMGTAMDAFNVFKYSPKERKEMDILAKLLIQEYRGIPVEVQEQAHRIGYNLEDWLPAQPAELEALGAIDKIVQWRGLGQSLGESETAYRYSLTREAWRRVDELRADRQKKQLDLDSQWARFVRGDPGEDKINLNQWEAQSRDLSTEFSHTLEGLNSPDSKYFNALMTLDERVEFAKTHSVSPIILSELEEIKQLFFFKNPDDPEFQVYDPEEGRVRTDWTGYYAWLARIEYAVPERYRQEWDEWLSRNLTPLQKLRRQDYDQFIKPYKAVGEAVLEGLPPEEADVVKEYRALDQGMTDRRAELRARVSSTGRQVISAYESERAELRRRLRVLDPGVDARLLFWGEVSAPASEAGRQLHGQLLSDRGFSSGRNQ